uniref:L1 transposable element RRM domain-containing protein n=1 Tax=Oreochromis aureus TaxID=47969 RepID=A0A668TBT9_OREAU
MPPKPTKGGSSIRPHLRPASPNEPLTHPKSGTAAQAATSSDVGALKAELLSALHEDFAATLKTEFQAILGESLSSIKSELLSFKKELSSGLSAMQESFTGLKVTVAEMERSLSTCTDDIVSLQRKVEHLTKAVAKLENKCDDLESRSRRQNIRIVGVPEDDPLSASTAAISRLLKEAFDLAEEPLLDRAHRTLAPKPKTGERPHPIVARLHYYTDCVKILSRARELQRIKVNNMTISVFPDYTAKTARARAAFADCRRQLRGIEGVRFGLLHPARLRITHDGVTRDFTSPEEANTYIKMITK